MKTSTLVTGGAALTIAAVAFTVIALFNAPGTVDAALNTEKSAQGFNKKFHGKGNFHGKKGKNLKKLVEEGVITQAQADALEELKETHKKGDWKAKKEEHLEVLASLLGTTADELKAALEDGKKPHEIAEEQGLSKEDLQAAMQEAHDAKIAEKVASGELTQEQADAMKAIRDYKNIQKEEHRAERLTTLATLLNLTEAEVEAQLKDGKKPHEIAEAQGISEEEFKAAMQENMKQKLAEMVENGELTQEQADKKLEHMEKSGKKGFGKKGSGKRGKKGRKGGSFGKLRNS